MSEELKVVAAAICRDGLTFSTERPTRHHDVIRAMVGVGVDTPIRGEQGFLLSDGSFASRIKARAVAYKAGQIKSGRGATHELFSEDVW